MRSVEPSVLRPQRRGFTLIEILVIVVILAVLAGAVTLAIGGVGGERQLAREAEQLRALVSYACEQAERGGRDIGISLDTHGYQFNVSNRTEWEPAGSNELRPREWLGGAFPRLTRDGRQIQIAEKAPDKPQLVCFASGELTPFRMDLALADLPHLYRLDGEMSGDVTLAVVDARAR
jgi:general secretion pathway protein H